MPEYLPRIVDRELDLRLQASGATLIVGPKWCGKTTTGEQKAFEIQIFTHCSRYYSRYDFFRRICSSRPGDGEQRRQSLAALTARGRGLDCLQPQPRQPVLRQNKLRIFRFRASAKAQSLRLFLLSPRSRLLRGDPIYGRTLCVQTDWAA